jgi:PAS domain S-box-containing protein
MSRADAARPTLEQPRVAHGTLAHVFRSTAEPLALLRAADGMILDVNDALLRLLAVDRRVLVGQSSFALGMWADLGDDATAHALLLQRPCDDLMASIATPAGGVASMKVSAEVIPASEDCEAMILVHAAEPESVARTSERFRVVQESEARYRSLVEQLPAIVYTEVADGRSPTGYRDVYISPQTEATLGYTADEWRADPQLWQKVTYLEDLDGVNREERRSLATGTPFSSTYRMVGRDGRIVWFRDDAVLVKEPDSGLEVWKGVMLDITEQKLAEEHLAEAEASYRALVERIPAIVYHSEFSTQGAWLYVSPQVEDIFGLTPREWMDHPHPMASFCHPDDIERVRATEERSHQTGEPFRAEYRMRTASTDGWRWFADEASVVRDEAGRPLHMLGVMFDITERKRSEVAVREALQRETRASDRLRALDALKNTLLHTLSHDLRNPLAAIQATASTMEHLGDDLSSPERTELLATIQDRTRRMSELLSDLLDLDRLDRGIVEPKLSEEPLREVTAAALADCDDLDDRAVELRADDVRIPIDRTKVVRIVENLVSNAARHTPPGTAITVAVRAVDGGALIVVDDEGAGVPDELKEAIFEEFRRGPDPGTKGTGIGLSLVSRFAALHGGRAWVEDASGGGASFRVFLPNPRPRPDGRMSA